MYIHLGYELNGKPSEKNDLLAGLPDAKIDSTCALG